MPRTKLDSNHWKQLAVNRVQSAIRLSDFAQYEVAEALGVTAACLSYKLRNMTMTLEDFSKIADKVGMDDETILKIVRR